MRCSVCGTENTPDSRFCGGCGARVAAPNPRVAPTAKISDDAAYPASTGHPSAHAPGPASIPPGAAVGPPSMPGGHGYAPAGPPSIAPQNHGSFAPPPASIPPQSYSVPPQNHSVPPQNHSVPPQNHFYTPPPGSIAPGSIAPSNGVPSPGSIPPQNMASGPVSQRSMPSGSRAPQVSARHSASPSLSVPPRRRWGLVITVLLFDLALAGAGIYLLSEGLS